MYLLSVSDFGDLFQMQVEVEVWVNFRGKRYVLKPSKKKISEQFFQAKVGVHYLKQLC